RRRRSVSAAPRGQSRPRSTSPHSRSSPPRWRGSRTGAPPPPRWVRSGPSRCRSGSSPRTSPAAAALRGDGRGRDTRAGDCRPRPASPDARGPRSGAPARSARGRAPRGGTAPRAAGPPSRRPARGARGRPRTPGDTRAGTPTRTRCSEGRSRARRRPGSTEDRQHLLDAVAQRVLGEGALAGALADVARLVGMGQVIGEMAAQLLQVAVDERLLAGGEEVPQLLLVV